MDLSDTLRSMGFTPTGEESPVHDEGMLWRNGVEIVCDKTATVIDGRHHEGDSSTNRVYRYNNSEKVMLPGGHVSSYEWGDDEDGTFRY